MDKLFQSKWFIKIISLALAITLYVFVTVETNVNKTDSRVPLGTSNEIQVLEEVPLGIKIDSEEYVVSGVPEHVKVSLEGKTSVLTPIVRQQNFNVFVDLRDYKEGEHTVEIEYENVPEDLTAYIEPKTIDVTIEKRASREFTVEVDFVNLDKLPLGYEIGEAEVTPTTVKIISSESIIDQIAMVKVFVDVTDLKESIQNREVPVSVYDVQGNDLKVLLDPQSVTISVPVERPSKTVPLNVVTKGELPEGFELDKVETEEEIEIFGKRELLNQINEISTKEIDLGRIEKSDLYEVEIDFPEGITANNEKVEVDIQLMQEKVFEDISIESEGENEGTVTFLQPENSKVNIAALGNDKVINTLTKQDISAVIRVDNLSEGTHEIDLTVKGPNGVTLEPEIDKVSIEIE